MSYYEKDLIYIEPSENDIESRLPLMPPEQLGAFLDSLNWSERKEEIARITPFVHTAKDPVATARALIRRSRGSAELEQSVSLSMVHQVGLGTVADLWLEMPQEAFAADDIGIVAFVRVMVQLGRVAWNTPETTRLRDKLVSHGLGYAYLADPTLDTDALLVIWRTINRSAYFRDVGAHPNATEEFWRQTLDHPQVSVIAWERVYGCARARNVPEVRQKMLACVAIGDLERCIKTPNASSELLAFGLEGLCQRAIRAGLDGDNSVLDSHVKRLSEENRLDAELMTWLCNSPMGAVRLWAQLSLAPKAMGDTTPSAPTAVGTDAARKRKRD